MTYETDYKRDIVNAITPEEQAETWNKYLAEKFKVDGDTTIFKEIQIRAFRRVQELQIQRYVEGTLTNREYRIRCRRATDRVNDKLKEYGITTGFTQAWVDSMNDNYFIKERQFIGRDLVTRAELNAACVGVRKVALDMFRDFNRKFVPTIAEDTVIDEVR